MDRETTQTKERRFGRQRSIQCECVKHASSRLPRTTDVFLCNLLPPGRAADGNISIHASEDAAFTPQPATGVAAAARAGRGRHPPLRREIGQRRHGGRIDPRCSSHRCRRWLCAAPVGDAPAIGGHPPGRGPHHAVPSPTRGVSGGTAAGTRQRLALEPAHRCSRMWKERSPPWRHREAVQPRRAASRTRKVWSAAAPGLRRVPHPTAAR